MAVTYTFYTTTYKGNSIPQADFDRVILRAEAQLEKWSRVWEISAPADVANAEEMALCAMADAFYFYETQQNGGWVSSTIGSVSSSKGSKVDISTAAQDKEMLKCAELYLDIYKGVGKW